MGQAEDQAAWNVCWARVRITERDSRHVLGQRAALLYALERAGRWVNQHDLRSLFYNPWSAHTIWTRMSELERLGVVRRRWSATGRGLDWKAMQGGENGQ